MNRGRRAAVVGGGLAGLAAAHQLRKRGADVLLLESSEQVGGVCRSVRHEGFLVDLGPNTVVARSRLLPELIEDVGLGDRVVRAPRESSIRYVVRRGQPVPLPSGPGSLLRTPLFSVRGKVRALAEPFISRGGGGGEETVAAFVRRRLGPEVLAYGVDPFISGVFAGDPERLVLGYTFPMVAAIERDHRSLLVGGMKRMRSPSTAAEPAVDRRPFSFEEGMGELPAGLARSLGHAVRLASPVSDVRHTEGAFAIILKGPAGPEVIHADAVVLALPPHEIARMSVVASAAGALQTIPTPPVAVLGLGFRREDVEHSLEGFGVLVPGREPFRLLGALFSSSMFPGRAPAGHALLTCFLGGRRRPEDALLSEEAQLALVLPELRSLLGVRGDPVAVVRKVWKRAIPQYEQGHGSVIEALAELEAQHHGLAVAGSMRGGVSVGDVLAGGIEAAERVLASGTR